MPEATWKNFNQEHLISEIEKRVREHVVFNNDIEEANKFVGWLEPMLVASSEFAREAPEMVARYERVILQCKYIALGLLSWDDIAEVFEKNIMTLFEMPDYYELLPRIKAKLLAEPEYETRDDIKKRLREALLRSQEYFVDYLQIEEDGQVAKPATVENFLHDYVAAVGIAPAQSIKRSEYLTKNKNVAKLNQEDRKKLEELIALFERLKLSSITPEGLEEHVSTEIDGKAVVFKEGRFEDEIEPRVLEIIKKMKEAGFFPGSDTGKTAEPVAQNAQKTETPAAPPVVAVSPVQPVQPVQPVKKIPAVSHDVHPLRVELEEVVEQTVKNVELRMQNAEWLKDVVLAKRFRTIVSARLRDVRDAGETATMLERSVKVGGMGLPAPTPPNLPSGRGGSVELIMEQIEKSFSEFQEKWKAFEKKRMEDWKSKQRMDQEVRREQGVKKEQEEIDARYARLVGEVKPQAPHLSLRTSSPSGRGTGNFSSPAGRGEGEGGLPSKVVSLSSVKQPSVVLPTPPPPEPTLKPIPAPALPKPVLPSRALPSHPPEPPLGQGGKVLSRGGNPPTSYPLHPTSSKITDVRTPPKLTGPLEELKGLTLEDFRRLGSPQEAAAKISARIEMFGKESLRRRIDGIKAWQVCEVNRIYQAITATSFSERKNMLQVLEERKGRNMPTLTPDEFHVIMELNTKLRF